MSDELAGPVERIMRWAARVLGSLIAAFVLLMFLGDALVGGGGSRGPSQREVVEIALFLAGIMGLLIGWRWEIIGGAGVGPWRLPRGGPEAA